MGTEIGSAVPGSERLTADRAWVRWGVGAAVTAMLAWVAGVALIRLNAKLDKGGQHLAQVLRTHSGQLYVAAPLAVVGAVLLAGFSPCSSAWCRRATRAGACCASRWPGA